MQNSNDWKSLNCKFKTKNHEKLQTKDQREAQNKNGLHHWKKLIDSKKKLGANLLGIKKNGSKLWLQIFWNRSFKKFVAAASNCNLKFNSVYSFKF